MSRWSHLTSSLHVNKRVVVVFCCVFFFAMAFVFSICYAQYVDPRALAQTVREHKCDIRLILVCDWKSRGWPAAQRSALLHAVVSIKMEVSYDGLSEDAKQACMPLRALVHSSLLHPLPCCNWPCAYTTAAARAREMLCLMTLPLSKCNVQDVFQSMHLRTTHMYF